MNEYKVAMTIVGVVVLAVVLLLNLFVMGVIGGVIAWMWNMLLVPNMEAPIILWWQAAIGVLGIRMLIGVLKN